MSLVFQTTNAGRAALVNAQNTGTLPVVVTQIGITATAFTASASATALPGELKRLTTFGASSVADDIIHVTMRDDSASVYDLRGFALYLEDGTLFGLYGQADPILQKSASATALLSADVKFADIAATDITFGETSFQNPPATTTVQGVVELATDAEVATGTDTQRAVTPKGLRALLDSRFGSGAPSAFVKGLLSLTTAALMRAALEIKSAALKDEGAGNGLDADKLDGKEGSYYLDWSNFTGSPSAFPPAAHTHAAADITSGTFANARISQASVTQHQAALSIAWSQLTSVPAYGTRWPSWSEVTSKPSSFTPDAHTHTWADITGTVPTWNQNTTGSAASLTTARTLKIGNTGKTFNGTANVTWTLAEIGAATSDHNHTLDGLSNVTITSNTEGEVLQWNGTAWINRTLAEAGILSTTATAAAATKLATARTINGTSFNGTANITTANWGTARTLKIGATGKSVNGSANVTWTLAEIGAAGLGANTFTGVQTATGFTVSSSRALKQDIRALEVSPDIVDLFQPVTFRYKAAPEREVAGMIREDVAEIFPLAVTDDGIDYGQLVPLLIATIQRDRARLRDLADRVAALEARSV